jgi:hypothetical protein
MVIHTGLAEGDDFGVFGQRGEFLEEIHGAFIEDIARVEPDDGVDILVFFGSPPTLQLSNVHLMRKADGRSSGDAS